MKQLKDLISIDRRFQNSVNLQLDIENNKKINNYIPTRSSVAVLENFLENVIDDKNKANILIGPYGKGKSHLLLVLLAILSDKNGRNTKEVIKKIGKASKTAKDKADEIQKRERPFLPVLISGTEKDLNIGMLIGLTDALKKKDLMDIAPNSYYKEAISTIEKWKNQYKETYKQLEKKLELYRISINELEDNLKSMDEEALNIFKKIYPHLTAGSEFSPIIKSNASELYKEINETLCNQKGYGGIYIIFDEFSKYIEGHDKDTFSYDMKIIQDFCELASNSKKNQIHITFVAHKSIKEYGNSIPKEIVNAFTGVEGRLKEEKFIVSAQNNYELIKYAINKNSKEYEDVIFDNGFNQEIIENSYKIPCFQSMFKENDYKNIVAKGCFPMLPLTSYCLLNISEKIAQNERSIFTFLANDERGSLVNIVEEGEENLIAVDAIYDYFQNLFRENTSLTNVHNEWLKADYALTKAESLYEERIIKTIAILHMIKKPEELPVKEDVIRYAANMSREDFVNTLEKLQEKNIVVFRNKLGIYAFKNNVGINLNKEIDQTVQKFPLNLNWSEIAGNISDLEYILPKKYNQEYTMTRYFKYVYMLPEQFLKVTKSSYLFETYKADGLIVCLIMLHENDLDEIKKHAEILNDNRIVVIYPKIILGKDMQMNIRKILAINALLKDKSFIEENLVLKQELEIYKEDILFEINAYFETVYMPENEKSYSYLCSDDNEYKFDTAQKFNRFLSDICSNYYEFAPKINNELINRHNVSTQIKKARNKIIDSILEEEDFSKYEAGTSPEATIFRATLFSTGITKNGLYNPEEMDEGSKLILKEIKKFIKKCAGKKNSFKKLYECLMGKNYGARKGIIPIFLAKEIVTLQDMPVVYLQDKEVPVSSEILNNINDDPDNYFLYVEKESIQKEQYLNVLEEQFLTEEILSKDTSKRRKLMNIVNGMQRWYRSLDQYTLTFKEQITEADITKMPETEFDKMCDFRNIFRRMDLNPRDVLFMQIPEIFGEVSNDEVYKDSINEICKIKAFLDEHLDTTKIYVAAQLKSVFGAEKNESLSACLKTWYGKQSDKAKSHIFSENMTGFMTYIENLNTNDELEIVSRLSKIISGIYINDWKDDSCESFIRETKSIKNTVETIHEDEQNQSGENKISFVDSSGKPVEKYYEADEDDSTSYFLKNAIEDALDEFGDTLEMNQKVSVLVKALENLLKQ